MPNKLDILKHPHPMLKEKCTELTVEQGRVHEYLWRLAQDMIYTIGPEANGGKPIGVGLAAPQVGFPVRLCVVTGTTPPLVMINPVIERTKGWTKGSAAEKEGCLSLPGVFEFVYRAEVVWVRFQSLDLKTGMVAEQTTKAKGWIARIIAHELDHLDGIEFTDRVAEQKEANHGR